MITTIILFTIILNATSTKLPKLLLISMDGFRHDYVEKYNLSVFKRFMSNGAHSKRVKSCFTTVTFPNHFSIATGLYEDRHGIISNEMYDPVLNKTFSMHDDSDKCIWYQQNPMAVPIWTYNQLNGGSSGTVCWVASECNFKMSPLDRHAPCGTSPNKTIHTAIEWLTNSTHPANFVAIYFDQPDKTGHEHGPDSEQMLIALNNLEKSLEQLEKLIEEADLTNELNVLIVSDHGMHNVDANRSSLVLSDYIDSSQYKAYGTTTVKSIFPKSEEARLSIIHNLSRVDHINIYSPSQLSRLYYSNNSRLGELIIVAEPGFLIFKTNQGKDYYTNKGNHGYMNFNEDMFTIFMAKGPSFKPNSSIELMTIVDIFPLMVELLNLSYSVSTSVSQMNGGEKAGSLAVTVPLLSYIPKHIDDKKKERTVVYALAVAFASLSCIVAFLATVGILHTSWKQRRQQQLTPLVEDNDSLI